MSRTLKDVRVVEQLAAGLAVVPEVQAFDTLSEPQSSTLAHALADIEESCAVIVNERMAELMGALGDADRLQAALLDIGEDLAHILYHVRDASYFGYVVERVESASS